MISMIVEVLAASAFLSRLRVLRFPRLLSSLTFMILTWLSITFESECCYQFRRCFRQTGKANTIVVLFELYRLIGGVESRRSNLVGQISNYDCFARPIMHVCEQR